MSRTIRMINDENYEISLTDETVRSHFERSTNCTREILVQTNESKIYDGIVTEDDKIILDLGANVGLFAIHVSPFAEKIYCVEPTPSHFNILTKLTSAFKNIERIEAAISSETGEVDFYEFESNSTMNTLFSRVPFGVPIKVKSFSLPDLLDSLKLDKIDFCKIDIEGSESIAITEEVISSISTKIKKLFIEFHWYAGLPYEHYCSVYKPIFEKYGYVVSDCNINPQLGPDCLYCQKEI